jgi:hypothetical protein
MHTGAAAATPKKPEGFLFHEGVCVLEATAPAAGAAVPGSERGAGAEVQVMATVLEARGGQPEVRDLWGTCLLHSYGV